LKEKALAALRNHIRNIVIPNQNKKDLDDLPPYVKKKLNFIPVRHMDEVLRVALTPQRQQMKNRKAQSIKRSIGPTARFTTKVSKF
jgi:ATP-dependent Lon protease